MNVACTFPSSILSLETPAYQKHDLTRAGSKETDSMSTSLADLLKEEEKEKEEQEEKEEREEGGRERGRI